MEVHKFRYQMNQKTVLWSFVFAITGIGYFYLKSNGNVSNPELNSTLFAACAALMTFAGVFIVLCYLLSLFVIRHIEVTADEIRIPKSYFTQKIRIYRFKDILAAHVSAISSVPVVTFFFEDKEEMLVGSLFQSKQDFHQFVDLLRERIKSEPTQEQKL